jgi:hypothetical protein
MKKRHTERAETAKGHFPFVQIREIGLTIGDNVLHVTTVSDTRYGEHKDSLITDVI